jgi:hypothetical protein
VRTRLVQAEMVSGVSPHLFLLLMPLLVGNRFTGLQSPDEDSR